jgi:hypothetical protein
VKQSVTGPVDLNKQVVAARGSLFISSASGDPGYGAGTDKAAGLRFYAKGKLK